MSLQKKIHMYNDLLPAELATMKRAGASVKNPLFRFLERECSVLSQLLDTVRADFAGVLEMCQGEKKTPNHIKTLGKALHADVVPTHWKKYTVPDAITASEWLNDFKKRVDQLAQLSTSTDLGRSGLWFGGLLSPEAYLIATQQATA